MQKQGIIPKEFEIESLRVAQENIKGILIRVASKAKCPLCQEESKRIQSKYLRTVAELPWSGVAVEFSLQVRRFYCDNRKCVRKIFNERIQYIIA